MVKRIGPTVRAWYVMVQPGAPQECHPVTVYTVVAASAEDAVREISAITTKTNRIIAVVTDFSVVGPHGAYSAFSSIPSDQIGVSSERS